MPKETQEPKETPMTRSEAKPAVTYRYVGEGTYLHGVPARDLTDDDLEALKGLYTEQVGDGDKTRDVTKKMLEASGIYERKDSK